MNERGRGGSEKEGELFEQSAVHIFGEGEGQVQQLQCGHDKAPSLPSRASTGPGTGP